MGGQALRIDDAEVASWSRFLGKSVRVENRISARSVCQDQPAQYRSRNLPNTRHSLQSLHSNAPFSPHNNGARDMRDTSDLSRRSFVDHKHEARTRLKRSLEMHVTDPAKVVARKVDASPDTVEAHRREVPKSWAQMIAYCRAYPAFALDVVEAMGLDLDRDREAYSTFLSLQRQMRGER